MNTLLYLALMLATGLSFGIFMRRLQAPMVTGYVLGGVLLGGSIFLLFGNNSDFINTYLLGPAVTSRYGILADLTLSIIAFSIGAELELELLRQLGRSIIWIVLLEASAAFILVVIAIVILPPHNLALALVLGAVASATAPAATVAVINQYRAKGPLTSTILAVVGIDDAIALIIYAFASSLAMSMLGGKVSIMRAIIEPFRNIGLALAVGGGLGFIFAYLLQKVEKVEDSIILICVLLLVVSGLADHLQVSALLANLANGAILINRAPFLKHRLHTAFSGLTPLFYPLFFVYAGAHLDITLLPKIGIVGLFYLVARMTGKIYGAQLGAVLGQASETVRKYIGFSLIPQVGVAVALALVVQKQFGGGQFGPQGETLASITINVLLFTTIITEIVGPYMTKKVLIESGEATVLS